MAPDGLPPKPGSPEFIAMIEREKDYIEQQTGIRPTLILDIGVGDIPGYGEPVPETSEIARKKPRKQRR